MRMRYLNDYIKQSLADGKYFFTKGEVLPVLGCTQEELRFQAYRLMRKKVIRSLTRDSFMIIPAEYQNFGGVPPHWIIDQLMQHLGQDYYIGLLSSASMYGSTHQQPMSFQVITNKARRPIKFDRCMIEFHVFKECSTAMKEQISSPAGYASISIKEQTMLDLVRFYQVCGYLSNVSSVIKDIAHSSSESVLIEAVSNEKNNSVLQRLGFILYVTGFENLANIVHNELSNRKTQFILLRPDVRSRDGERDMRFRVIINDSIEVE